MLDPHSDTFSSGKMKEGYIQWCLGKFLTTGILGGKKTIANFGGKFSHHDHF